MDVETHISPKPSVKHWFEAMRLRTLPLALASSITGGFLAMAFSQFDWAVFILTALTTILLQINSNLANDFGDFQHGTDNEDRIGPERSIQSGMINSSQMKRAIVICSALSFISGVLLLYISPISNVSKIVLLILGCAAIAASIKYTAGKNPYGYSGFGDLAVVVFFGFLGVLGSYFVQTAELNWWIFLPAVSIGALSAGVLNVNNLRDADSDRRSGKFTLAVKLGPEKGRWYHLLLIATGIDALLLLGWFKFDAWYQWMFLLLVPFLIIQAFRVFHTYDSKAMDKYLKPLAITTFLISILIAIGSNL